MAVTKLVNLFDGALIGRIYPELGFSPDIWEREESKM